MSNTASSLEPAASIIAKFGGPEAVMKLTGMSRTRVYRWTQPKARGGTGGLIPIVHAQTLFLAAKAGGIDVSAEEFLAPACLAEDDAPASSCPAKSAPTLSQEAAR